MQTPTKISILLLVLAAAGCTTVVGRVSKVAPPVTYPGVQADLVGLHGPGHIPAWVAYSYCALDLPFSAALDTVMLPLDLRREHHDTNYWQQAASQVQSNHVPLWPPTSGGSK